MQEYLYEDIINLPHHVSRKRTKMPMGGRAAQFAPFAALAGYGDAIDETGRVTEARCELDESEIEELNRRIFFLMANADEGHKVSIKYFLPDKRKEGGEYKHVSGTVAKYSMADKTITMCNGTVIRIDDIVEISSVAFEELER